MTHGRIPSNDKVVSTNRDPLQLEVAHKKILASLQSQADPLWHILHSNDAPSHQQLKDVADLLMAVKVEISRHKRQHIGSRSSNRNCKNFEQNLDSLVARCRCFSSASRRLPTEVLDVVFLHCVRFSPSTRYDGYFPFRQPVQQIPWKIGWICNRWRSILLSRPELWSHLQLDASYLHKSALEIAIRRSEDYPLNILLLVPNAEPYISPGLVLLLALLPHSERWSDVALHIPPELLYPLEQVRGRLSTLRSIAIHPPPPPPYKLPIYMSLLQNSRWLDVAPALREAHLHAGTAYSPMFPWSQLTSIHEAGDRDCLTALSLSPSLMEYHQCHPMFTRDVPATAVMHVNLRHLKLPSVKSLQHLTLPNLEVLHVSHDQRDRGPSGSSVISFLARSKCPLKILKLVNIRITSGRDMFDSLLKNIPLIEELSLTFNFETNVAPVTRALTMRVDNRPVPNLTFLKICVPSWKSGDTPALIAMIGSRRRSSIASRRVARLRYVTAGRTFPETKVLATRWVQDESTIRWITAEDRSGLPFYFPGINYF